MDTQNNVYASEAFNVSDCELKSGKNLKITGFISTTNRDNNNDIVSEEGQQNLVSQIKQRISSNTHITMDLDHESFRKQNGDMYDDIQNKIPVARIDDCELVNDGGVTKTKVSATINDAHPLYESIKKSIKNKFLHSFSIAYKVTDGLVTMVDGVKTRIINDVVLRNIGITGVPVNDDAGFEVSLKSYLKKMEQEKQFEEINVSMTELKSSLESKDKVIAELKSSLEESAKAVDAKFEELNVAELKSELKELKETLAELKSKGIHKAPANVAVETKVEDVNVFALM